MIAIGRLVSTISFYIIDNKVKLSSMQRESRPDRIATAPRIQWAAPVGMKKTLARAARSTDIVAVRHDLPHMPSLGVSSLDSRPPWRHGGLLFYPVCALCGLCAALVCAAVQHWPSVFRRHRARRPSFGRQAACLGIAAQRQRQSLDRREQIFLERGPAFGSDNPALIEVESPGDLDLNCMSAVRRRAEMLGDVSAGEGLIAADAITRALEARFQNV